MTSTLPPIVQAVSGAFGGAAANASSYPLDLICTRLQTSESRERQGISSAINTLRHVVKKRGILGLYDGLETDTAATLLSSFCYFYAYSFMRDRTFKKQSSKVSPAFTVLEEIAIGFLAGVSSRAISTPLSLITVRLQTEQRENSEDTENVQGVDGPDLDSAGRIMSVMKHIYQESGLRGFWRGFETTTLLCLNPSLTLVLFQAFRRIILRGRDRDQPSPYQAFIGAALSNVIAVTALYPLILAKTRLQSARKSSSGDKDVAYSQATSMLDVWRAAYRRDGFAGLYQGLEVQLVKGFLSQGLTMMIKQRLEQIVIALYLFRIRSRRSTLLEKFEIKD